MNTTWRMWLRRSDKNHSLPLTFVFGIWIFWIERKEKKKGKQNCRDASVSVKWMSQYKFYQNLRFELKTWNLQRRKYINSSWLLEEGEKEIERERILKLCSGCVCRCVYVGVFMSVCVYVCLSINLIKQIVFLTRDNNSYIYEQSGCINEYWFVKWLLWLVSQRILI